MANKVRPRGAEVKGALRRSNKYVAGTAVYPGDFVSLESSGRASAASVTSALCGVALSYASAAGKDLIVADCPEQEFIVQASSTEIAAQTNLNLNYDIVATSPDTTYKKSKMTLDSSTGATTATLPLKALAIDARDDNAFGGNVDVVVVINNHQLKGGTGTIGT